MSPHQRPHAEPATRHSHALVAGLWCAAAAAAALTAYGVVVLVQWNVIGPPPDLEGPSAFAALLLVTMYSGWASVEALAVWAVLAHTLRRFPHGKQTSILVLAGVAFSHARLTASLAGAEPLVLIVVGAAVPLALAAAMLVALA